MNKDIVILPSLLGCKFTNLEDQFEKMKKAGIKYVHYDCMDGNFVPNVSFGESIFPSIHKLGLLEDVHLMVTDPVRHAYNFAKLGAKMISVHFEAFNNCTQIINFVNSFKNDFKNICIGLAIKPKTTFNNYYKVLEYFDFILVMTVEPGLGGQSFITETLETIKLVNRYKIENNLNYLIEVDGGINDITSKEVIAAGASLLVAGSYIFVDDGNMIKEQVNKIIKGVN